MSSIVKNLTPEVLRNVGVPILVNEVSRDEDGNPTPTGKEVEIRLKFTNWRLHLVEERFGTVQDFYTSLDSKMYTAVMHVIAICTDWPDQVAAEAIRTTDIDQYVMASVMAMEMAFGRDPKDLISQFEDEMRKREPEKTEEKTETVEEPTTSESWTTTDDSAGSSYGDRGSWPDTSPTNFGIAPSPSSLH